MRIALAADHNGVQLKTRLGAWLVDRGHDVEDLGTNDEETVDYPALCVAIGARIGDGHADRGIMIGGTGGGEMIALNRMHGVRAGLATTDLGTRISRAHNDSNVLVLGTKLITSETAEQLTELWLTTPFKGGRHQQRLDQIAAIERGSSPE